MKVTMLGKTRRAKGGYYYAAYTTTGHVVEFIPMPDASPAFIGKLNKALPAHKPDIEIDTNDILKLRGVGWTDTDD